MEIVGGRKIDLVTALETRVLPLGGLLRAASRSMPTVSSSSSSPFSVISIDAS